VDLLWQGAEVSQYDRLKSDAHNAGKALPSFVKEIIEVAIQRRTQR
jgi:predicted DNA-binding protein